MFRLYTQAPRHIADYAQKHLSRLFPHPLQGGFHHAVGPNLFQSGPRTG